MEDEETRKLFKNYELMMKLFRQHLQDCPTFAKKVLKMASEFEK